MRRFLLAGLALLLAGGAVRAETVVIGSKSFAESWILGEALATVIDERTEHEGVHRRNLGGTEIAFAALESGQIDAYPDYTGTISEAILSTERRLDLDAMRERLADAGIGISDPLGFNNSYALAVTPETQERYGLETIGDLREHPELRLAFSHEFVEREDGWRGLARHYDLPQEPRGIQHELAYSALGEGRIDVTDIYTTDAQIERMELVLLDDDRGFFPRYDAVVLYRLSLAERAPAALAAMRSLEGAIDEPAMIAANSEVVLDGRGERAAAWSLLNDVLDEPLGADAPAAATTARRIAANTLQHLKLVALSLLAAVLVGIPLGVLAERLPRLRGVVLSATGLLQTVPSLALLAFLVPVLGIGVWPALVALFLYSLLPIVRNTYTGLANIPPNLVEAAEAIGLPPRERLLRVYLPMASPSISAGIKTSAVINVGTATLAAFIGAGGLGDPILTGIQLRDDGLILQGAIPAALLALLVQGLFDVLDRWVIPLGLRLPQEGG